MGKTLPNTGNNSERIPAEPAEMAFVEGVSASMRPVEAVIRELAQSDVPVLVLAEAGAGKQATAQRIHQMSQRSSEPFLWFQCLGLRPDDLGVLQEKFSPAPAGETRDLNRKLALECSQDAVDVSNHVASRDFNLSLQGAGRD